MRNYDEKEVNSAANKTITKYYKINMSKFNKLT